MTKLTGFEKPAVINQEGSILQYYLLRDSQVQLDLNICLTETLKNLPSHTDHSPILSKTVYLQTQKQERHLVFVQVRILPEESEFGVSQLITLIDLTEEAICDLYYERAPLTKENIYYGIVGKTPQMQELFNLINLASESMVNALITGESGTGKELVARAIHANSNRRHQPFITVNCSALTETLLESELFGHVKGSFTGAYKDKIGKFEAAQMGTIFLDEIGDISPLIQLKLLRVIQEKSIERVGDNRLIDVDMRIITATNKNLRESVRKGLFREDLYYRLKVFPIQLVPLRERKNDIPLLCEHFIKYFNQKTNKQIKGLTPNVQRLIMDYCWPGNVRELENVLEYAFVLTQGEWLDTFDLPAELRSRPLKEELCRGKETITSQLTTGQTLTRSDNTSPLPETPAPPAEATAPLPPAYSRSNRKKISKEELLKILAKNQGNKLETARELNISRVALWKKIKSLGIA
jgi:transcriptional regulator with GAF, ATPase, and Fis domain